MSDQKMQECFEFFYDLKWEQVNDFAQQAWKAAWMASRECMVIELPEEDQNGKIRWTAAMRAIESTGAKVNP